MKNGIIDYVMERAESAMPCDWSLQVAHFRTWPGCPACFKTHKLHPVREGETLVCDCGTTFEIREDQKNDGYFYCGSENLVDRGEDACM